MDRLEAMSAGLSTVTFLDPLPEAEFQQALSAADVLLVNEHAGLREMAVPSKMPEDRTITAAKRMRSKPLKASRPSHSNPDT